MCTTCHAIVCNGETIYPYLEECEAGRLELAPDLTLHSRLGCQAVVEGDIVVEIAEWNRNYVNEGGGSINFDYAIPLRLKPRLASRSRCFN